ncbi:hypothetical protein ACIGXM_25175 [Kitasatospora sp. NPDC052896]|uniref:hypothetical protein n=1 Tax=Kitasatospora sp. NPDC052896 TaxID=3364061 RepID=UPI0037C819C5
MTRHRTNGPASPDQRWRAVEEPYRALVVRNRVDEQFLAIEQQHRRLQEFCRNMTTAGGLLAIFSADRSRGITDVDFFLLALRRLHRVGELIRRSALPTAPLRQQLRDFDQRIKPVMTIRDVLEHLDDVAVEGRGGIGWGIGDDRLSVTYSGVTIDTFELFTAARNLHAAVRTVVDPIAANEPHGQAPIIDMHHGPACAALGSPS